MREIVLDTETTGMSAKQGHRIVEIGALELVDQMPTGERLHIYVNPERDIDAGAVQVHGLTGEFLADKSVFADIADEFLDFIGDSPLVIHNAEFDMEFINAELGRIRRKPLAMERAVDTLAMARKKYPGQAASLDALCRRYEIDNSHRNLHGALVDADLLASVYIELLGGRQRGLSLDAAKSEVAERVATPSPGLPAVPGEVDGRFDRAHDASAPELAAHAKLVERIPNAVWNM